MQQEQCFEATSSICKSLAQRYPLLSLLPPVSLWHGRSSRPCTARTSWQMPSKRTSYRKSNAPRTARDFASLPGCKVRPEIRERVNEWKIFFEKQRDTANSFPATSALYSKVSLPLKQHNLFIATKSVCGSIKQCRRFSSTGATIRQGFRQ